MENADVKLALEEMKMNFREISIGGDLLVKKAMALFVLIIAMLWYRVESLEYTYFCLFSLVLLSFVFLPRNYKLPMAAEWGALNESLFDKEERDVILTLLSGYTDQIKNNARINKIKSLLFSWALYVFVVASIFTIVGMHGA